MKKFNTTGICLPDQHYIVDLTARIDAIRQMVVRGEYFCVNRGRQFGKTTTLGCLASRLSEDYCVISLSFEVLGEADYRTDESIMLAFMQLMAARLKYKMVPNANEEMQKVIAQYSARYTNEMPVREMSNLISDLCIAAPKPVVLIVDEVDQASNFASFLKLLGLLRNKYLERHLLPTFQSVILAGVYDIKNLKLKLRPEELHQSNSPWNIASDFKIEMHFSAQDIATMLEAYEADHHTGMDVDSLSQWLYTQTSGYPYLTTRLCQLMDEQQLAWDESGAMSALKSMIAEKNVLFDDVMKKMHDFPELSDLVQRILYQGAVIPFNPADKAMEIGCMFDFLCEDHGVLKVSNRVFETWFYELFASQSKTEEPLFAEGLRDKNQFVSNGMLDMRLILTKFCEHFNDIYADEPETFIEAKGRKLFMLYLRPIINGVGHYYVEAQTRDNTRTDLIVDYLGQQYVIEMKIWHGNAYHESGEKQLREYLNYFHLKKGYLVSFCFNKHKQPGIRTITLDGCEIVEAMI